MNKATLVPASAATVLVKAPMDANVLVDGQATTRSSAEETFTTPVLEPDRTYQYVFEVKAVRDGKPVTRTKQVLVQAGKQSEVDFSDLGAAATGVAKVTVVGPADAKITVDGVECTLAGGERTFETPKLEAGRQYFYTVKAEVVREGRPQTETQRVVVEAGKHARVQFNQLDVVQAALR
jgi:uncharacterized protein (TIGR03000 family)